MNLGNYSDFERRRERAAGDKTGTAAAPSPGKGSRAPQPPAGRRPADALETEIGDLEDQLRGIEERLADHETYNDRTLVAELSQEHEATSDRLRILYKEWEQAADQHAGD